MAYETHNIIKQAYDTFGMRRQESKLYLGDLRKEMTVSVLRSLEKMLDKHSNKDAYHIMIHSRFDPVSKRQFKTVFIILPAHADMMSYKTLGTMAFFVDNRRQLFKRLWILPYDKPTLEGSAEGNPEPGIAKDAADMPLKGVILTK